MKKYFSYLKINFIKELQYRAAAIAGLSTQFFFGFIFISVYIAFFESGSSDVGMNLSETVTYLWLGQAFLTLLSQSYADKELMEAVKSGSIANELIRPQSLYFMWYAKLLGERSAKAFLRFLPVIVVAMLLPAPYKMLTPVSIPAFILFLLTMFLGVVLVTAIVELYPILTLKTISDMGIVPLFITTADILAGGVVPIPYFPKFLQVISKCLPFQYVSDLPYRIYTGNIIVGDVIQNIVMQLIWIVILVIVGHTIMNKSLKRVVVQGG